MKLARALSWIGLAISVLAIAAWTFSYARPTTATLIRARPDRCWFLSSRYGKLTFWAQEIFPPLPSKDFDVKLSEPFHMRVSGSGSLFSMNYNPDWPRPDLGWHTVQDARGVTYGPSGQAYNFTLRVRSIVLAWWVMVAVGMIPMSLRGVGLLIRRRRIATGRCVVCGYDLRASPERCPECGANVERGAYNPKS